MWLHTWICISNQLSSRNFLLKYLSTITWSGRGCSFFSFSGLASVVWLVGLVWVCLGFFLIPLERNFLPQKQFASWTWGLALAPMKTPLLSCRWICTLSLHSSENLSNMHKDLLSPFHAKKYLFPSSSRRWINWTSAAFTDWMLLWGGEKGTTNLAAVTKVRGKGAEQQMPGLLWAANTGRST